MKRIIISTDCVADLPEDYRKKKNIYMMHYYIQVEKARFQDVFEMDSSSLIRYIEVHEDFPKSSSASAEEYRAYFQKISKEAAGGVVHISMGKYASDGYNMAKKASEDMKDVHVLDSGALSSSMAILALYAADMAERGCPLPVLLSALEKKRNKLSTSFVVDNTEYMIRSGKMNGRVGRLLESLRLHPFFNMSGSRICLAGFCPGSEKNYAKRYINWALKDTASIDPSLLFITTAGCTEELKEWLKQEAKKG